ncbi:hypothetical protein MRX96_046185 [Rhipicephalus microplus]
MTNPLRVSTHLGLYCARRLRYVHEAASREPSVTPRKVTLRVVRDEVSEWRARRAHICCVFREMKLSAWSESEQGPRGELG